MQQTIQRNERFKVEKKDGMRSCNKDRIIYIHLLESGGKLFCIRETGVCFQLPFSFYRRKNLCPTFSYTKFHPQTLSCQKLNP